MHFEGYFKDYCNEFKYLCLYYKIDMGTFVHPANLLWELLSTVPKWHGNFCPQCQTCVGTIVHPVKNGMGTFVRGNYCPIIKTGWVF